MRPRLSIITPVYNARSFVDVALATILRQGFEPGEWEVIAVDDGSIDGTGELLRERSQSYPWLRVVSQENQGAGAARNRGIDEARGKYLYFFDVDDGLEDGALSSLVGTCVEERLDVLFFGGSVAYESPEAERTRPQDPRYFERRQRPGVMDGESMFVAQQRDGNYCGSPCVLMTRTDFVREQGVRFAEGIINEDNLFVLRATLRAQRADVDPRKLFQYRVRMGSVTTLNWSGDKRFLAHLVLGQEFELERARALRQGKKELADAIGALTGWYADIVLENCPDDVGAVEGLGEGDARFAAFAARLARVAADERAARHAEARRAEEAERALAEAQEQIAELENSTAWKVGRAVTALPRALKDAVKR